MDRICNEALLRKVTTPRAAAAHIKNGMTVGFSGFTVIGYPKVLPAELARRAEEGEELGITVITGGNVGDQLDGVLARSGVMKRRYGFQGNRDLRALANAVLSALARSELDHLSVYTEVMQDAVVELIDAGKVACASGTALTISPSARERFYAHIDDYKGKIILRPQELSNAPEVIRRLSIIAMNTAIEVDLAGNVNSTHIGEGAVMNGIGGSGDYARNSGIAIFSTASTAKDGAISCIVPHVAHVDHTEHDTEIIVTEQGLADLRGLTAYERAHVLIENCAHPKFRPGLREYVEQAYAQSKAKHGIIRL